MWPGISAQKYAKTRILSEFCSVSFADFCESFVTFAVQCFPISQRPLRQSSANSAVHRFSHAGACAYSPPVQYPRMSLPLLLGHRGARAIRTVRENTFASFDLAMAHGCDGFEFDVRLTADEHAVICHDATTDGCEISRAVMSDLPQFPQLEAVLDRYADQAFLDIELKVTELETATLNALYLNPPKKGYVLSSFLPEVLLTLRGLDADVPLALICETQSQLAVWKGLPIQYLIPQHTLVDNNLCEMAHAADKKVLVWTVNKRNALLHFRDIAVDGIISDDTRLLVEVLRPEKSSQSGDPEPKA